MTSDVGCARFIDGNSTFVSKEIVDNGLQKISNEQNLVSSPGHPVTLDKNLIGPEPAHGWCYYFEKTDLALQNQDYTTIQKNYQAVTAKNLKTSLG